MDHNSNQVPLFFDQFEEALGYVVSALGGAKQVGLLLRADMSADAAGRWVLDCLNPDRPQFFHPSQIALLLKAAREANIHAAMDWFCQSAGYAKPAPIEPQDEQAALMRQFIQAAELVQKLAPRLEALAGMAAPASASMRVVR